MRHDHNWWPAATPVRIATCRAVSVNTVTLAAPAHRSCSVAAWPADGRDSTVCSVTRYGMPQSESAWAS